MAPQGPVEQTGNIFCMEMAEEQLNKMRNITEQVNGRQASNTASELCRFRES